MFQLAIVGLFYFELLQFHYISNKCKFLLRLSIFYILLLPFLTITKMIIRGCTLPAETPSVFLPIFFFFVSGGGGGGLAYLPAY